MKSSQKDALSILNLKPISIRVLEALKELGPSPAADIAAHTNKPKPSVYDGIDELMALGMVVEENGGPARIFSLSKPEQIEGIKKAKISLMETAFAEISKMTRESKSGTVARPRIRFYSGKEGIQQAFRDMPWTSKHKDAYLMWPMKEMLDAVGEPFLKLHSEGHLKHKVMIHSIRKDSDRALEKKNHDWLESNRTEKLREVRYAPKNTDWNMSYWAYGDQTLFAGSGSESFAFIIRSREFADLMTLLWHQMWDKAVI